MNILYFDWNNYGQKDIIDTFTLLGHSVTVHHFNMKNRRNDPILEKDITAYISKHNFDFLFSINYYPVVSNACKKANLKYISWVYDSPLVTLYSYTVINPCNYIFIFDHTLVNELNSAGIPNIYYLPLGVNSSRLCTLNTPIAYEHDISFVGSLYNEKKHQLFDRLTDMSEYTKGYLDGIMNAQKKIYGYYFIEELLNDTVLNDLIRAYDVPPNSDGVEAYTYAYAYYFIARKITSDERIDFLNLLSNKFLVDLYTHHTSPQLPAVNYCGIIDYYKEMPHIFNSSKINLNVTLRSIRSGIPLRALDIMGAGGFLISNYQEDFNDFFTDGTDYVVYQDCNDLINKCDYYLYHEKEREEIALNGHKKTIEYCSYTNRIQTILSTVFPNEM